MKIAEYGKAITSYIESPTKKEKDLLKLRAESASADRTLLADGTPPPSKPKQLKDLFEKINRTVLAVRSNTIQPEFILPALEELTQEYVADGLISGAEARKFAIERKEYWDKWISENPKQTTPVFDFDNEGNATEVDQEEIIKRINEADGGRIGFSQGTVEEFVEIVKKMVADPDYMSPININAREVGKIPNFETAKKIVKQEMGEAEFNQAYQKNINRSRKVRAKEKRKIDPDLREKYLASKAERRRRRRIEKLGDKTKLTAREKYLNFEQSLITKQLNEKIRKNPNIILNNKKLMDELATTVDINGNIIKKKVNLSEITNRGIYEIEHQRDIYKTGKMKDFPYNRNLILGPHNRSDGFKATAEKFISKNPDSPKVKTILKKANDLKITLQPDVPEGTFKTKGIGYTQVKDPVKKFIDVAEKSTPDISKNLGVSSYSKNLSKAKAALGIGLKTAGKVIKPIGYAFGANAVKSAIGKADEMNIDLSPIDLFMALDSGDADIAINNYKRRNDPEFAAAERAKDLAQMTDDFEEVGKETTFGKYNDQIKNIKLP